ncbi:hypothetical protein O3M35_006907 [Rhynocoris fuscipes]|uniref:Uncharacterized protein n=1 Tax=Rhynocoris fuscipes TaxID=488301 RepID=A0AAW1DFQ8_9HEMI
MSTFAYRLKGNTAQRRDRGRRYLPKRRNQGSYTLSPVKRALSRTRKRHDSLEIDNRILKYLRNMDLHRKRMEDIQERMAHIFRIY